MMAQSEAIVKACCDLVRGVATVGACKVMLTEQAPAKLGPTAATIKSCIEEVHRDAQAPVEVHPKTSFSMLGCESVRNTIVGGPKGCKVSDKNTWDHVVIVGIETHVCVLQTVQDIAVLLQAEEGPATGSTVGTTSPPSTAASSAPIPDEASSHTSTARNSTRIHVILDAVCSQHSGERSIAIDRMLRLPRVVGSTVETCLFELMQSAAHPRFRDISKLVRARQTDKAASELVSL